MTFPPKIADLLDRVGWTFAQSLAGSVLAAGTTAAALSQFDYRTALAAAGASAVLALLKVIAVQAAPSGPNPGANAAAVPAQPGDELSPGGRSAAGVAALSATPPGQ